MSSPAALNAQQLLHERALSLAEVAVSAGFSDQTKLTQSFKRKVGVTPGNLGKSAEDE
jgi:AraC-like DNA-binding protein